MKRVILLIASCASLHLAVAQYPSGGGGGRPGGMPGGMPGAPAAAPQPTFTPTGPKGNSELRGTVIDSATSEAVPYATIALFGEDPAKPVDGAVADTDGKFVLRKLAPGTYRARISSLGYTELVVSDIQIEKSKDADLGTLRLAAVATTLNEVAITGQRSLIEEKVDRLVYNAEKDLTSRGGDASDVLRKVPLLAVDLEGNVSLRGSSNIRVLINNKPSTILASSVADALKQIPADMIKSVEVITSPSARYDAEGSGGIINIITKKTTLQGLTLNVDTGIGNRGANLGLNGNYRKGPLGLSLGGWGRAFYNRAISDFDQTTLINGVTRITEQDVDARDLGAFGNYNLGFDYDLGKNQSLTGNVRYGLRGFRRVQDQETHVFEGSNLLFESFRDVNSRDFSNNVDVNLDYLRIFKPQQEWSIAAQYSRNNLTNNFDADLLNGSNEITSREKNLNLNVNQEITVQTDYQTPIKKNQLLEIGGKGIFRQVLSDFSYQIATGSSGEFIQDFTRPFGELDYVQDVGAGYVSYTLSTKQKFNIKAGVRYEYTFIAANQQGVGEIEIADYGNVVPSLNLSKTLKKGPTIKLGYNRRIQRPGLQQLNPNFNAANPQNITVGNPTLRPELTDNLEISLGTSLKKSYISMSLFGRLTDNAITQVRVPSDSIAGAVITTFENIGQQQTLGMNAFGNVTLAPWWTIGGGFDVFYAILEGQAPGAGGVSETVRNSGFNLNGRMNTQITLKNGWGIQGFGFVRGSQVQLQGRQAGFGIYSLGIRKEFNEKRGSIGLSGENFFTRGILQRTELTSPQFTQVNETRLLNNGVRVNFSYRFGKMSFEQQQRRRSRSVNNDDVKQGEDNNGGGGGGAPGGGGRQR